MTRPTWLEIDRAALRHNLQRVRELAPSSAVIAMVKANAYGHGLAVIAKALSEANAFGVAFLEEAKALRAAGIEQPIVVCEGFYSKDELSEIDAAYADLEI